MVITILDADITLGNNSFLVYTNIDPGAFAYDLGHIVV